MSDPLSAGRPGETGVAEHTHHWLIGNQDGPSSPAVCKECGEHRDFSNGFTRRTSFTQGGSSRQYAPKGPAGG